MTSSDVETTSDVEGETTSEGETPTGGGDGTVLLTEGFEDAAAGAPPDGYDTLINQEGDNISIGEKQLMTIARAFLANPSILILDEATSSVDTRTEVLIQEAMNALRQDRTSFVIAHRLSTIRGADVILVMEDGRIVEQGGHHELLERHGAYARLHGAQFAGEAT